MSGKIDVSKEIGKRYGRLTVLSKVPERTKWGKLKILCQCDCGKLKEVIYYGIKSGATKSCGCLRNMILLCNRNNPMKHGDTLKESRHHYLYNTWAAIKSRCFNPNENQYKDYGGRGITIYQPWVDDYQSFKTWILENLGERKDGESIDRINVDENYIPGNLRWANAHIQSKNRRNSLKESDIVGQKFGRFEIISVVETKKYTHKRVLCKCECGKLKEVYYSNIQSGGTKSCGCLLRQKKS